MKNICLNGRSLIKPAGLCLLGAGCLLLSSCASPAPPRPRTGYVSPEEAGVMTVALDDHDYDLVAEGVAKEMFMRGLPKGYVVASIDHTDSTYRTQAAFGSTLPAGPVHTNRVFYSPLLI